jgi:hypothetical protein
MALVAPSEPLFRRMALEVPVQNRFAPTGEGTAHAKIPH